MIVTSPEMILKNLSIFKLISSPGIAETVIATIIDECHCIPQWSNDFRVAYKDLGELRTVFLPGVPVLVASATLTKKNRSEVAAAMLMEKSRTFFLNLAYSGYSIRRLSGNMFTSSVSAKGGLN